jgi:hypothetical protein
MSADEHLNEEQFSTWYHGTTLTAARSIQREGLRSDVMGQPNGHPYYTLASHADEAAGWGGGASKQGWADKPGALVEVHVPDDKAQEYLGMDPHKSLGFMGKPRLSGIQKPLPPEMIHRVTPL